MIKVVPKEIKDEIIQKIKEGQKVLALAKQYGLSDKTIYRWLSNTVSPEITFSKYSRLKRENEELKRIIGMISYDLEQEKKRKVHKGFK